jgi:hypothetical protein
MKAASKDEKNTMEAMARGHKKNISTSHGRLACCGNESLLERRFVSVRRAVQSCQKKVENKTTGEPT